MYICASLMILGLMMVTAPFGARIDKGLQVIFGWALNFPVLLFIGGLTLGIIGVILFTIEVTSDTP